MTDTPEQPPKALPPDVYPPERLEIDEFHLRRYTLDDTEPLHEAIKASFAEIHPWMPWCTDPVRIEDQKAFIERSFTQWTTGHSFNWAIADTTGTVIGAISLMDRTGRAGLEIGYWLRTDRTGQGIVTRATAKLTELALSLPGIELAEIHCDEANLRSAAVPQRLGYRLEKIIDEKIEAPGETGRGMIWVTP